MANNQWWGGEDGGPSGMDEREMQAFLQGQGASVPVIQARTEYINGKPYIRMNPDDPSTLMPMEEWSRQMKATYKGNSGGWLDSIFSNMPTLMGGAGLTAGLGNLAGLWGGDALTAGTGSNSLLGGAGGDTLGTGGLSYDAALNLSLIHI